MWLNRKLRSVVRLPKVSRSAIERRWGRLCLEPLEDRLAPAQLTVTSVLDPATLAAGTLRYAVAQANTDVAQGISDTIVFNPAQMGGNTITLQQGQLELKAGTGTTTIDGGGQVTVSGNNASRVFRVDGNAILAGLTIAHGNASGGNAVNGIAYWGTLTGNDGGGIANEGTLTVIGSTLTGNSAAEYGGGIDNYGTLTVTNSALSGNSVGSSGGGIENWGTLTVTSATLSGNSAGNGGGIVNITGSVPYGYSYLEAGFVGSRYYNGAVTLQNAIVAGNSATSGGAAGPDVSGSVVSGSAYNLIGNGSGMTGISNGNNHNQIGTGASPINPLLAPLGNYGGTIQTMALLPGSPAVGAGEAIPGVATDQRGVPIPNPPDIGAYQTQVVASITVSAPATATAGIDFSVTISARDQYGNTATGYTGPVTLADSDGQSLVPTAVLLTNGTVTTFVTLDTADTTTLTAAAGAIKGVSAGISVSPAAPASFVVSAPAAVTAGAGFSVTITATDQYGNFASSFTGPVTLTSSDGQPVTPAAVILTNGTASLVVSLGTAAVTTLSATAGTVGDSSDSITVNAVLFEQNSAGTVVELDQSGALIRLTSSTTAAQSLATGVVTIVVDGGGAVFAENSSHDLNWFAPGSNLAQKVDGGVVNFALDGAGSVVELNSSGVLSRFAPGSGVRQAIDGGAATFQIPGVYQVFTSAVESFAVDGAGDVIGLQKSIGLSLGEAGHIWGDPLVLFRPGSNIGGILATDVTSFDLDGAGTAVALDLSGNLYRFDPKAGLQVLATKVTTSTLDGAGSVVALDASGNLISFAPGSALPQKLDAGVARFTIDGAGWVVELNAGGILSHFAPGSTVRQVLDSNVTSFALDGWDSVVDWDKDRTLNVFPAGLASKQQIDTGVNSFVVDASGAVFALEQATLPSGMFYLNSLSAPAIYGTLVRFAPGSTTGQFVDRYVGALALDGSGAVVALDKTPTSPLGGYVSNSPLWNLIRFDTLSGARQQIDTSVSAFVVDGSGAVVALDAPSGSAMDHNFSGTLVRFEPGKADREVIDALAVSSFALDGSGSVVALDVWHNLSLFLPGFTWGQKVDSGVSSFALDGSNSVVALEQNGILERFAPGSVAQQPMGSQVNSFAVDGKGYVLALDKSKRLTRFAPGSISGQVIDTKVYGFGVDGKGYAVALDGDIHQGTLVYDIVKTQTFAGHNLVEFAPGLSKRVVLNSLVTTFVVEAEGSVVALSPDGNLYRFAPGFLSGAAGVQTIDTGIADGNSFALDGSGSVVALEQNGNLVRFLPGSWVKQLMDRNVMTFTLDWTRSVVALERTYFPGPLQALHILAPTAVLFAPGSNVRQIMANFVVDLKVDYTGYVVLVANGAQGDLERFTPGTASNPTILDHNVLKFAFNKADHSLQIIHNPNHTTTALIQIGLVVGDALVSAFTGGVLAPEVSGLVFGADITDDLIVAWDVADFIGDAVGGLVGSAITQGLNTLLLGTPFSWSKLFLNGFSAGLNVLNEVVPDVSGGILDAQFSKATASFLKQVALHGLPNSILTQGELTFLTAGVTDGLTLVPFTKGAMDFLHEVGSTATTSTAFAKAGLTLLNAIVATNLSRSPFASGALSFMINVVSGSLKGPDLTKAIGLFYPVFKLDKGNNIMAQLVAIMLQEAAKANS